MVGILLISHGTLSSQLIETAELIVGEHLNLHSVNLEPSQGLEDIKQAIADASQVMNKDGEGILALVDLQGGTPCNAAFMMLNQIDMTIVSGVNLPMLLEVLIVRKGKTLEELTDIAMQSGKEGIKNISALYKKK